MCTTSNIEMHILYAVKLPLNSIGIDAPHLTRILGLQIAIRPIFAIPKSLRSEQHDHIRKNNQDPKDDSIVDFKFSILVSIKLFD